ncbi:chemotaxis-specific protein-glutamate methyltransferase CheB [Treponema sp.]|uniref:chemotaxis-specific protein-glutamate methyltransferase CheB n=1 Tax=Treponema sp. TaxID=166 RepID=UPI00388FFE33
MIRVLIADDSAIVRAMLGQVLGDDSRFEIVGMAENGKHAVELCLELKPDLVVMDINMPILNGIDAIIQIKEKMNPAIVAFTTEDTAEIGYKCLDAGAIDVVQKPNLATMNRHKIENFCDQLTIISEAYRKHMEKSNELRNIYYAQSLAKEIIKGKNTQPEKQEQLRFSVLAIGASTGGPVAIQKLLRALKPLFPLPIIITQHIDEVFDTQFAKWLSNTTGHEVKTATDGEILQAGHVYIAPSKKHLMLKKKSDRNYAIVLDDSEEVHFLKPAVDKMFTSCAEVVGSKTLAILLTGMGQDGAQGMKKIHDAGGYTIAESEKSSVVFGMPKAAVDMNAVTRIEDLDYMGEIIRTITGATRG